MPNILLAAVRKSIIDQINGEENKSRKNESLRRFDVYQKRQARYLRERLIKEYSPETVNEMRLISSINLGSRIVDAQASLYVKPPTRTFSRSNGVPLTEKEQEQLDALYEYCAFNTQLKKSNRYYKLEQQGAIQLIPKNGVIYPRVLLPHHYDVIPDEANPEMAAAYVMSVYDRSLLYNQTYTQDSGSNYLPEKESDQINQRISDADDQMGAKDRYIWWSKDFNFITDGNGNLIDETGTPLLIRTAEDLQMISNPIGKLPFVDIACGKEFEFWVRQGNDVIDFALDFGVLLSDTAEINKRQGYSQAIVESEEPPKDMLVGPNRILHLKQDPNKEIQPKFSWSNPAPDMAAALQLLETYLSLFLTSQNLDPKTVSGKAEATKFTSGLDRLLYMIDRFEASQDDMDLYQWVEQETLEIMVAWSNIMQGATQNGGTQPLRPELQKGQLPTDIKVTVTYSTPQAIQSPTEIEESQIKLLDSSLTTRKKAIMKIHGVSEEEAEKMIKEIDSENTVTYRVTPPADAEVNDQVDSADMAEDQLTY